MKLLLDTHVLIWWLGGERLSESVREEVEQAANEVLVSAVSVWEAEIKAAAGRLELSGDLLLGIERSGFRELPVRASHGRAAAVLPRHHGDPFDRMLVAQARAEEATLVTRDRRLEAYDVPLLAA